MSRAGRNSELPYSLGIRNATLMDLCQAHFCFTQSGIPQLCGTICYEICGFFKISSRIIFLRVRNKTMVIRGI